MGFIGISLKFDYRISYIDEIEAELSAKIELGKLFTSLFDASLIKQYK